MNFARIFAVVVTLGVLSTASSQETPKQDSPIVIHRLGLADIARFLRIAGVRRG